MKFIKALLWCLLGFTLAFLLMFFIVYKGYKEYNDISTITLNILTGDLNNNILPSLENIELAFPGKSDDEIRNCTSDSNILVKVTAVKAKDEDGMISRLVFYYYNVDNPSRVLEYREASSISPYSYFILPKAKGEYRFGVILYDNNGGVVDSENIIGKGPTIYNSSCNLLAPIITLISNHNEVAVGDTVTYSIVSRIVSRDTTDFEKNRLFYYDFTGDGKRDLITENDFANYTFSEIDDDSVVPIAAVKYRDYFIRGEGEKIFVNGGKTQEEKYEKEMEELESMNEYEKNKQEILAILPASLKSKISGLFDDFEENSYDPEGRAEALLNIWNTTIQEGKKNKGLDDNDIAKVVQPAFCNIFEYYDILWDDNRCTNGAIVRFAYEIQ